MWTGVQARIRPQIGFTQFFPSTLCCLYCDVTVDVFTTPRIEWPPRIRTRLPRSPCLNQSSSTTALHFHVVATGCGHSLKLFFILQSDYSPEMDVHITVVRYMSRRLGLCFVCSIEERVRNTNQQYFVSQFVFVKLVEKEMGCLALFTHVFV